MKKTKKLYIAELPAVSHEFAQELARRFPVKEVKPGVNHDDLLYAAGQRSVVDFVIKYASGTVISGDVEDLKPTEHSVSMLDKIIGIIKS